MDPNYNSSNSNLPEDANADIKRYISIFISNWYWFVFSFFCAITIAYFINNYSQNQFIISSSLLIKDDKNEQGLKGVESIVPGGDIFRSQQNLQNEIGILKSFSLNLRVINELPDFHVTYLGVGRRGIAETRMYNDCPIVLIYDTLSKQDINLPITIVVTSREEIQIEINGDVKINDTLKFGQRFNKEGFDFTVNLRNPESFIFREDVINSYKVTFESPINLANAYRGALNIQPIDKEATLVSMTISGPVRVQLAEYLNKLMEVYLIQEIEEKNITADSTINFIEDQIKLIGDSLNEAENDLEYFRLKNNLIDLSSEGAILKSRMEKFETEKTVVMQQLSYYEYLREYIRTKNESGEIMSPSIMNVTDPSLIKIIDELSSLQKQKKHLLNNFAEGISAIKLIEKEIEEARAVLAENIRNSVENVERSLVDVTGRVSDVTESISKLPGIERELITIQRKFDLNNTVYTYMLEKRSEAEIGRASNVSDNRIIDRAEAFNSSKIYPRNSRNIIIAILLGFIIPALYIFLTDQLNNKIIDKKDIEKRTAMPVLGFIGHSEYKSNLPVVSFPGSALSESFRSIRTNLKYMVGTGGSTIISVNSTISGEGKTFISTNLASIFGLLGKKTLVVGLDLRKPRFHKIFPTTNNIGLSTFLIGESEFDEIIHKTEVENLYFTPSGPVPPNPAELIESERMALFMSKAKEVFDFIILDTPPVGIVSDALLLNKFADINLFVVRQRYSAKNTLEFIQDIFEKKEMKNPAIIVNDISVSGYFGYGLRYGTGLYPGYGYDYGYGRYGSYHYGRMGDYYSKD